MKAIKLTLTSLLIFMGSESIAREVEPECEIRISTETVFGKVLREDSRRPIQNVTVTAIMLNKKEKYTITDTEGEFGIEELKPGMYKFIFEKDGYRRVIKERVNIKLNVPIELNIEMEYLTYNMVPSPFRFLLVDIP
jgi:hypothetical protein